MFTLHDRTRRRLLLAGFFVLCVMPTLVTLSWCVAVHLPGAKRSEAEPTASGVSEPSAPPGPGAPAAPSGDSLQAEARRLSQTLGVKVFLAGVSRPRSGVVQYEGLELFDPETGRRMFRCGLLEVLWQPASDRQERGQPEVVLRASQTSVNADELDRLGEVVGHILRRKTGWPEIAASIHGGEILLHGTGVKSVLTDVQARLDALEAGTQAALSFRLAGTAMPEPARILLIRSRQVTPPAFGFELVTGPSALPCNLLALGIPEFGGLGDQSRFSGTVWANQTRHGWEGEITQARLSGIDLGSLVGQHSPHALRGTGDVAINRARFRDGRIEEADGGLATGPGAISCSLIEAAELGLGLASHVRLGPPSQLAQYEELAFRFRLDARGVVLQGCCANTAPNTVLVDRTGPILTQVSSEPQPVASLIRTLVPGEMLGVPATRQSDRLARLLPLPQSASAGVRVGTSP